MITHAQACCSTVDTITADQKKAVLDHIVETHMRMVRASDFCSDRWYMKLSELDQLMLDEKERAEYAELAERGDCPDRYDRVAPVCPGLERCRNVFVRHATAPMLRKEMEKLVDEHGPRLVPEYVRGGDNMQKRKEDESSGEKAEESLEEAIRAVKKERHRGMGLEKAVLKRLIGVMLARLRKRACKYTWTLLGPLLMLQRRFDRSDDRESEMYHVHPDLVDRHGKHLHDPRVPVCSTCRHGLCAKSGCGVPKHCLKSRGDYGNLNRIRRVQGKPRCCDPYNLTHVEEMMVSNYQIMSHIVKLQDGKNTSHMSLKGEDLLPLVLDGHSLKLHT